MRGPGDELFRLREEGASRSTAEAAGIGGNIDDMTDHIKQKRNKLELYQSESHKMKALMTQSANIHSGLGTGNERALNPLWVNFPTRCVRDIGSVAEMRDKLQYYSHSDDVMVVQYSQENCTACNAVGKVFELLCHQAKHRTPNLHFYSVNRNATPDLSKGMVRFPQIKGYSGGQWTDIDFKPPADFRDALYNQVEREVRVHKREGKPITALQAEEMYYSAAGPAMLEITEDNLNTYYMRTQVMLHNYWKQISLRRTWFYRKFIAPQIDDTMADAWRTKSVFGEKIVFGPHMQENNLET